MKRYVEWWGLILDKKERKRLVRKYGHDGYLQFMSDEGGQWYSALCTCGHDNYTSFHPLSPEDIFSTSRQLSCFECSKRIRVVAPSIKQDGTRSNKLSACGPPPTLMFAAPGAPPAPPGATAAASEAVVANVGGRLEDGSA